MVLSFEQPVALKKTNPIVIARVDVKNSFIETSDAYSSKSCANGALWTLEVRDLEGAGRREVLPAYFRSTIA